MTTLTNAELAAAIEVATHNVRASSATEVQHHMFKHHLTELLRIQRERAAAKPPVDFADVGSVVGAVLQK